MKDNPMKPIVIFAYIILTVATLSLLPDSCKRRDIIAKEDIDISEKANIAEYNEKKSNQLGRCY